MRGLQGKLALVTGAAGGIGRAICRRFVEEGVSVAGLDRDGAGLARLAGELGEEKLAPFVADISDHAAVAEAVAGIVARRGRIDILVNNAGTTKFAGHGDLDALSAEDFAAIYAVNVIGPFQMIRAAAPALKSTGSGTVVNVSSVAGIAGVGSSVAYAASKGALNTMTLSLARALGPEIRINAICPGYVATRWFSDRFGQERTDQISKSQARQTPLKRAGTPEDIADSVVFFCTNASRHITGELLAVDAGLHLSFA